MILNKCKICGKDIKKHHKDGITKYLKRKYCSRVCSNIGFRGENNPKYGKKIINKKCLNCGKDIIFIGTASVKKYCSQKCKLESFRKKMAEGHRVDCICKHCGTKFTEVKSRISIGWGKFCSKECRRLGRIGDKCNFWKGGISTETNKRISSFEWKNIRKDVYKRDNYTCQICGITGNKLKKIGCSINAHHIIPYRISKDNNMNNLITLCNSCHCKEERKYYHSLKGQTEFSFIGGEI